MPALHHLKTRRSGSALLIILGCVALLSILIISFFASARSEFSTSNFYAKGASTKLLSENVINLVIAQLREGARSTDITTHQNVAWASQPGMIRSYDDSGNPHAYFKLYSWDKMTGTGAFDPTVASESPPTGWSTSPNVFTDLNEPINGIYPIIDPSAKGVVEGFTYSAAPDVTASSTNQLPMPVKWLYVLKDGTIAMATATGAGTAVTISNSTATNPVIGRVAFWTDDETSKVNINTASEGTFWDSPIGSNLQEHGILGSVTAAQTNAPGQLGYAEALPAAEEFQAIPGHPATTSLSAVFGYNASVLPDTSLSNNALQYPLFPGTTGNYVTYFSPYFSLTPRYQSGGTMGGSQAPPSINFAPPAYRLYDSVDELQFDPSRTVMTSGGPATLYPSGNGANPAGRAALTKLTTQIINQRRFFITAHSRAPEETLFGTPRISLWPLQAQTVARTAKDNLLAFCSTIGGNPYYFQRATYFQYQPTAGGGVTTTQDANGINSSSSQDAYQDFSGVADVVGAPTPVGAATPKTGVARNEDLYAYLQALTGGQTGNGKSIPGFGGNFFNKYPGGANGSGVLTSDRDEILTEMFDFLRSGVNTFDVSASVYPHYSFSPFYANYGSYPVAYFGGGSTVPIQIASQGGSTVTTYGLGRNYGIGEVSLVFMAAGMDLNVGSLPLVPPTAAGTLDPGTNISPTAPIVPPETQSPTLFPPRLRRISIGANLPWACEWDNGTSSSLLYLDQKIPQHYGNYYIKTVSNVPTAYISPPSAVPAVPVPTTAVGVPIFYYWDTSTKTYGAYFAAPTTATTQGLFICGTPPGTPTPFPSPASGTMAATPLPSTAVTIADPQTTALQAFLLVRPFSPMVGNPCYAPNVRIRVSGLDTLRVTFNDGSSANLGFNSSSNAVMVVNSESNALSSSDGGLTEGVIGHSTADPISGANNGGSPACNDVTVPVPWPNDGTKPSTLITNVMGGSPNYNYPFIGKLIPLTTTCYPSPFGGQDADPFPASNPNNTVQLTPPAIPPPSPVQIHASVLSDGTTYAGSTMTLSGGTLQIDVLDGTNPTMPGSGANPSVPSANAAHFLQSLQLTIPGNTVLPMPTIEMANGRPYCGNEGESTGNPYNNQSGPRIPGYNISTGGGTPNSNPGYQAPSSQSPDNNYTYPKLGPLNYYWQLPYDPRNIVLRFARGMDRTINRGDVVRSFVINPASHVAGDMRMLAANPIQINPALPGDSQNYFYPIGGLLPSSYSTSSTLGPWTSPFIKQLHSLITDFGNGRSGYNLVLTSQASVAGSPATPIGASTMAAQNMGMGVTSGQLIPGEVYNGETSPVVTPELQGAYMDPVTKLIPGDWTLGIANNPDGGFVNKADEGMTETGYGSPYYSTNMGNTGFQGYDISYSPNRQVPSAIMFGTLPSRVMQGVPWCTLLFNPNPAANDANEPHPGFGQDTSGNTGPAASVPYTIPPDHLFLDLFWMPVVEPYAISEPFSTAGKVNLNYQIVPFGSYIHRSTALHAVMKSTRILAIATNFNNPAGGDPSAKATYLHTYNTPAPYGNYTMRYGINLAATIDDFSTPGNTTAYADSAFYQRFDTNHDLFRSASEICNIFLVPQEVPSAIYTYPPANIAPTPPLDASTTDMKNWWSNFKLTGDSGRKSPYNQIYPRLTTKSNTFQVHMRVQVLAQTPTDKGLGKFDTAAGDSVMSEYRGSATVERYLDPNQTTPTTLPDFATTFPNSPTDGTGTVDNYVRYRVLDVHAFSP